MNRFICLMALLGMMPALAAAGPPDKDLLDKGPADILDKSWTPGIHKASDALQVIECSVLAERRSFADEKSGFWHPTFHNYLGRRNFTSKPFARKDFSQSGCSRSFPVVPGCGGRQPGQILDKVPAVTCADTCVVLERNIAFRRRPCTQSRRKQRKKRKRPKAKAAETDPSQPKPAPGNGQPALDPTTNAQTNGSADGPLPRAKKRRRRAKADRGLPPDSELGRLATEYLQRQRKHWPELVKVGLLAEPCDIAITSMVEDFKSRHRGEPVSPDFAKLALKHCTKLGGNYDRYNCDNSDPKSIIDQMINCLDKARAEGRFVPWSYVFADYSVSGLDASRQGYNSYKQLLGEGKHPLDTTYIDDFSRASRDELEWWKLAAHSKRLNKRLIGASDSFDLSSANWDIQVTVFGLLSRLFIRSLRQKVLRGMRGTARKGGSLGKPPLGFTLKLKRDEHGNVLPGRNDKPKKEPCWDPATRDDGYRLFECFAVQNRTPYWIAKEFNRLKVDGWDGWTPGGIKKMLRNPAYIGVFIWNKTRREWDLDKEQWVVVKNPRSEWEVYHDPNLALIPMDWWRTTQRKLSAARRASPITGRKRSRNQISATTLFSGTLFCKYCGGELKLIRSAGKYRVMGCFNGPTGAHACKLTTSKSTRIIEYCLLSFLRDNIVSESSIEALVAKANAIVEQEASKPQVNSAALNAEVRKKEAKLQKLVLRIEDEPDEALCIAYHKRVKQLQKELNELNSKISEAEAGQRKQPTPLPLDRAKQYVAEFHKTMNEAIPVAAEAIRTLTGPISIRQEPIPFKNGFRWIATFGPDLVRVLRSVAKANSDLPNLVIGDGMVAPKIEVPIEKVPRYEKLAPKFKEMHDKGASVASIASAHQMSWEYVKEIIHFAETGERPKWKSGTATGRGQKIKYTAIAADVVSLRAQKMPFKQIAAKLGVGQGTVRRAFDHAQPEAVREAAERGELPRRGQYSHLGEEVYNKIRELLSKNIDAPAAEIAAAVGCGASTVNRVRQKMRAENQ